MGNSLLDFVMALVRDPEVAARYAADPAGALAGANLPGVTFADVANLIPVVTDSLAVATPGFGAGAGADSANVWTTSAAAAALDAFDIPHPGPAAQSESHIIAMPVDPAPVVPAPVVPAPVVPEAAAHPGPAPDVFVVDPGYLPAPEPVAHDWAGDGAWPLSHDPQIADPHPTDHPGFDLF